MTGKTSPETTLRPRRKAILCLCEDSQMLQVRQLLLEHFGYVVLPSSSVEDAKKMAECQCPDMLLMDNTDLDMDYEQLATQVKRVCPEVITVMLSPYFRVARNGKLSSIDHFVVKDDGPDALITEIQELLGGNEKPSHTMEDGANA